MSHDHVTTTSFQDFDRASDAIAVYTAATRAFASTIVYANDALSELSGYGKDHFVGHSAVLLAGAAPDARGLSSIVPPAGSDALRETVRKVRTDGTSYDVVVQVDPLRDLDGRITHYVARQRTVEASPALASSTAMGATSDRSLPLVLDPTFATRLVARGGSSMPRRSRGVGGRESNVARLLPSAMRRRFSA